MFAFTSLQNALEDIVDDELELPPKLPVQCQIRRDQAKNSTCNVEEITRRDR